jgi:Holliday junction resolvase RusA-like endonuclease
MTLTTTRTKKTTRAKVKTTTRRKKLASSTNLKAELGTRRVKREKPDPTPIIDPKQKYPIVLKVKSMGKPRMVKSDAWRKRPCVMAYWKFKDNVIAELKKQIFPHPVHLIFILPMPKSWSEKRKKQFDGQPLQQTPDWDNLAKGLIDALFKYDDHLYDVRTTKVWGREGYILLYPLAPITYPLTIDMIDSRTYPFN